MATHETLFGTKEWAPHNFNFMNGCSNDCTYCYAKEMAIRFKRKTSTSWKVEEHVSLKGKSFAKRDGRIMIPSSHDITPNNIDLALNIIKKLIDNDNELLIVTKPNYLCVKRLVDEFKNFRASIQFRFTIGSISDEVLKLWEPGASGFQERLKSLIYAYDNGYSTTVSIEPLLDETPDALYECLNQYVTDSIWIGKMNFPNRRVKMNEATSVVPPHVKRLMQAQCDENILAIWKKYKENPKIEWKESIKKVISLYNPVDD